MVGDQTRLALFDLDNTLVDRTAAFGRWAAGFAAEHALPPGAVEWLLAIDDGGLATRETVFSAARREFGLRESTEALELAYRRSYPEQFHPDQTVLDGLTRLRAAGWRVVIVTNGPRSQIDKIRRAGLDSVVDGWCISAEVGAEKPDAAIFHAAAARVALPLVGYMVGDQTETDILGAKRVGLTTVLLARGRSFPAAATTPDVLVDDVLAAIDLLATMGTPPAPR